MHITKGDIATARRTLFSRPHRERRPDELDFKVRPISEEWRATFRKPAYRTAVCNVSYIWHNASTIDRFGPMPYAFAERRCELQASGLALPAGAPRWAADPYRIWEQADIATAATGDPTAVAAWHVMMQIPDNTPPSMRAWLVREFVQQELSARGAPVAWAVHCLKEDDQPWIVPPHVHLVFGARHWRHEKRHGERHPAWIGSWAAQHRLGHAWRHWASAGAL